MSLHLVVVFIKEFDNQYTHIIGAGTVDGLDELAPDRREHEVQIVGVRALQILHHPFGADSAYVGHTVADEVGHGEKRMGVYPGAFTHLADTRVAESERDAETADYHQQLWIVIYQVTQTV